MFLGLQNWWHADWYQGNLAAPIGSTKRASSSLQMESWSWNLSSKWMEGECGEGGLGREERGKPLTSQTFLIHLLHLIHLIHLSWVTFYKDTEDPPDVGYILIHLWHLLWVTFQGCGPASKVEVVTFISKCFLWNAAHFSHSFVIEVVLNLHLCLPKLLIFFCMKEIQIQCLMSDEILLDPSSCRWIRWWISRWYVRSGQNLNRSQLWSLPIGFAISSRRSSLGQVKQSL